MVICIAFIGGKYCGQHATGYVKIWPSSTKSLPTPAIGSLTVLLSICNFLGGDVVFLGGITVLISFQSSFGLFFLRESASL